MQIERITLTNPPADESLYNYRLVKELVKQEGEDKRTDTNLFVSAEIGLINGKTIPKTVWAVPEINAYIKDFSSQEDDYCLIAGIKG